MTLLAGSFKAIAQNVPGISEAKKQLALITDSLANRAVSSIEILHMPDQMETRASVTPENLGKWFDFKVTVNKVNEWSGQDNLIKVFRTTTPTEGSRMGDMRSQLSSMVLTASVLGRYMLVGSLADISVSLVVQMERLQTCQSVSKEFYQLGSKI
jgi:hypothetical protein